MVMINSGSNNLVPLAHLLRMVLKFIYDFDHMPREDREKIQPAILDWEKHLHEKKGKRALRCKTDIHDPLLGDEPELEELKKLCWLLVENEKGKFDHRKRLFKLHNIDYRKFYKLPESYVPEDLVKAQWYLDKAKKENPEDYE